MNHISTLLEEFINKIEHVIVEVCEITRLIYEGGGYDGEHLHIGFIRLLAQQTACNAHVYLKP